MFFAFFKKDKEILTDIDKAMNSSFELRSKKELIERFIITLNIDSDVNRDWPIFVDKNRTDELENIIAEENLKPKETRKLIANALFRDGELRITGTGVAEILPPVAMFEENNSRSTKKFLVLERLRAFFDKYFDIV